MNVMRKKRFFLFYFFFNQGQNRISKTNKHDEKRTRKKII